MKRAWLLGAALAIGGCVPASRVERAYDGHVVEGAFVSPAAYAAFLRGVLAEAGGRVAEALEAYHEAARRAPASPEVWTRIGELRCRVSPRDPDASRSLSRALSLDPDYAPAWSASAACAAAGGDVAAARTSAERAAALDPRADGAQVMLARASGAATPEARARLVALSASAADPDAAWTALAAWARGTGDVALWAEALRERVTHVPSRRLETAQAAEVLAGLGETAEARAVAAAAVDAAAEPLPAGVALAARLAVDAALDAHDVPRAVARATRSRMSLEEVAGRALLGGDRASARALAREVSDADPGARGARILLAVTEGEDATAAVASAARAGDAPVSAAVRVALALGVARQGRDAARAAMAPLGPWTEAIVSGDDRVERLAVALASRGVLDASVLGPNGSVELAALTEGAPAVVPAGVDLRHELLALALGHPDAPRLFELRRRLAPVASLDPIVAAGTALAVLASGAPIAPDAPVQMLARNPADPLLAATALRLAERAGNRDVAVRARQALAAAWAQPQPKID